MLEHPNGVRIDILAARLPFEHSLIRRATKKRIAGREICVISIEDLVLIKLGSERAKDNEDALKLAKRHARSLDMSYLAPQVEATAETLYRPDLVR